MAVFNRGLKKVEDKMGNLSTGLNEVDTKVAMLKKKFEQTTQEGAKLKVELDKAQETIAAAENLVSKLEGEFQRWSSQVKTHVFLLMKYCWLFQVFMIIVLR